MSFVYLGLDYGDKNIGVSVSKNGRTTTGLSTIRRKEPEALRESYAAIKELIRTHAVTHIVIGDPVNMDGEPGERAIKTRAFKEKLQRLHKNKTVVLWDERLSTRAVSRVFEGKKKQYKSRVDEMAAVYILQSYLDAKQEVSMDTEFVVTKEDGEEIGYSILASSDSARGLFALAGDEDGNVSILKFISGDEDDEDFFDVEMLGPEFEDWEFALDLFKGELEDMEIDTEDIM